MALSKTLFLFIFLFFYFNSCGTNPTQKNNSSTLPGLESKKEPQNLNLALPPFKKITLLGDNEKPYFSNDSKRLLYVSKNRPNHAHSQIYEYSFETQRERRVTHHSGDDTDPRYSADNTQIYYSSTTDERRENHFFVKNTLAKYIQDPINSQNDLLKLFEIYRSHLDGTQILRLTHNPGFDANPYPHPTEPWIVYSSSNSKYLQLKLLNIKTNKIQYLTKDQFNHFQPTFSPDGKNLVWIKNVDEAKNSQLMFSDVTMKTQTVLTELPSQFVSLAWNPNGKELIISLDTQQKNDYDLYIYDLEKRCLLPIFHQKSNEQYGIFNQDGKQIIFVSDIEGSPQIYMIDYNQQNTCVGKII